MFDILPFPNITAKEPDERINQVVDYLLQFKEDLEFILTNLSTENLSPELQARIASVKASTDVFTAEQTEQIEQMKGVTVSDVLNSSAFLTYADNVTKYVDDSESDANKYTDNKLKELDYIVSGEQTQTSEEDGGINIYTFSNNDGSKSTFEVRNGKKGDKGDKGNNGDSVDVTFTLNYATGNLEYTVTYKEDRNEI